MKAAVVEAPERVVVREVPEPEAGEYQALCEILYGATCSGTDSHIVACTFPYLNPLPTIPGHESIARVLEVGRKVRHLKVGDLLTRVGTPAAGGCSVTWGGFAEYGVATDWRACQADGVPAEKWYAARVQQVLPPETDPAAATMVITWRETLSYITRMGLAAGMSVLVIGSGGNGLAYAAHAANGGAAPVAMIGSPARRDAAGRAGVSAFLDYHDDGARDAAAEACPDGYDLVIDAVGKVHTGNLGLSLLKRGGTIGLYGIDDFGQLTLDPTKARGTFRVYGEYLDEAETHEQVVSLVQAGTLDASIWLDLDEPFELADFAEAIQAVRSRKVVKALVRIRGE